MRNPSKLLLAVALPALVIGALPAKAQSESSYQRSCNHIQVMGDVLSAECARRDGTWRDSSIRIVGIANINGQFQFQGFDQASSYQRSCNTILIQGDVLSAQCQRADGSWDRTSIYIPGISNIDGQLQYQ